MMVKYECGYTSSISIVKEVYGDGISISIYPLSPLY